MLLGATVAAFVVGVAGGALPMFSSSAATEMLRRDVEVGCRYEVGLSLTRWVQPAGLDQPATGSFALPTFETATGAVDTAVGTQSGIGPGRVVVDSGATVQLDDRGNYRLLARDGGLDHVDVVDHDPGVQAGVWLPDVLAEDLDRGPGDQVSLSFSTTDTPVLVPVAGVYRDLRAQRDRSWCSLESYFRLPGTDNPPPPVLLMSTDALFATMRDANAARVQATWEYAPTGQDWHLSDAEDVVAHFDRVKNDADNSETELGAILGRGSGSVDAVDSVHRASRTAASIRSVAGPVALGTVGVALVMLLAAGRSWLQRRSQEVTLLALRGAGPLSLGTKAVLELLIPMLAGAAGGLAAALLVVRTAGPGPGIEPAAVTQGALFVGVALAGAAVAVGAVVGAGVRHVGVGTGAAVVRGRRTWWEPAVLALAFAALYEVRTRDTAIVGETRVDILVLLFPLLLLAGGGGLAARLALAGRPLGWSASRLPTPGWLALRRLAAARQRAALIVTGTAVAVGIVAFAGTLSSSIRTTSHAKTTLGAGAKQVVGTLEPVEADDVPALRDQATPVVRTHEPSVQTRGRDRADVMGVDPETFERAAFWDASFADRSLSGLLDELRTGGTGGTGGTDDGAVPAIAVGDLPPRFALALRDEDGNDVELRVAVAATADAFPGYQRLGDRPLVVVDRDELTSRRLGELDELWVDDASGTVAGQVADTGATVTTTLLPSADEGSLLQPQIWAVDYLKVVGLGAGLVTVCGLNLYFAANARRRQLGAAFARRLGLSWPRAAAATSIEVGIILAVGLVSGVVLSWLAARLVFDTLDPLPDAPPAPILRVDTTIVWVGALAAVAVAALASMLVERRAGRASLPRLLRDGR